MSYTRILFESSSITPVIKNDFRSIKAKKDIQEGELLLIEHVLKCSLTDMTPIVQYTPDLFNTLCPRKTIDTSKLVENPMLPIPQEIKNILKNKILQNSFRHPDGSLILGNRISSFNHNAIPNTTCYPREIDIRIQNYYPTVMCIIALKNISAGQEITISYGYHSPDNVHDFMNKNQDTLDAFNTVKNNKKNKYNKQHPCVTRICQQYFEIEQKNMDDIIYQQLAIEGVYNSTWSFYPYKMVSQKYINSIGSTKDLECELNRTIKKKIELFTHRNMR